jgi:hypothetical protein
MEPGQNDRELLQVTEYSRLRQFHKSGMSTVAILGVIHGAGRKPFLASRGVASRSAGRYGAAPLPAPMVVGGV